MSNSERAPNLVDAMFPCGEVVKKQPATEDALRWPTDNELKQARFCLALRKTQGRQIDVVTPRKKTTLAIFSRQSVRARKRGYGINSAKPTSYRAAAVLIEVTVTPTV